MRIIRNAWIDQTRRQRTAGIQLDIFEMPEALPTEISMIATFRPAEGQLCRGYETARDRMLRIVLTCRDADGWQARFAMRSEADGADCRPASGEDSIEATLAALGAGEPLTPADEARALRGLSEE